MHSAHTMVKPGGTGTPRFVISARLAPFPPSILFMSRVPSATPLPKKKTDCVIVSAAASEAELLRIRRRRRRIIAGEAGVAESARPSRYGLQHSIQRQISERVDAERVGNGADFEICGDQLFAVWSVDAVIARSRYRRRAYSHGYFACAGSTDHRHQTASRRAADDRVVHHHHASAVEHFTHRVVFHLYLCVTPGLRGLNECASDVMVANQGQLEWQL